MAQVATACCLRLRDEIDKAKTIAGRRGVQGFLASKANLDSYERYAKFRELIETDAARRQSPSASASAIWRKRDDIYRLRGYRCLSCGKVSISTSTSLYKLLLERQLRERAVGR
jgi:hypothetical protein